MQYYYESSELSKTGRYHVICPNLFEQLYVPDKITIDTTKTDIQLFEVQSDGIALRSYREEALFVDSNGNVIGQLNIDLSPWVDSLYGKQLMLIFDRGTSVNICVHYKPIPLQTQLFHSNGCRIVGEKKYWEFPQIFTKLTKVVIIPEPDTLMTDAPLIQSKINVPNDTDVFGLLNQPVELVANSQGYYLFDRTPFVNNLPGKHHLVTSASVKDLKFLYTGLN